MNDRELLELAAKSIGAEWDDIHHIWYSDNMEVSIGWNPLTDDGDALRLGTKIGMNLYINKQYCLAEVISDSESPSITAKELCNGDTLTATRRAIVRAAAEIGKAMEG